MTRLRRYLGERHRLLLWTLLVAGGGAAAMVRFESRLASYVELPIQIGVVVGLWLLGVLWIRWRAPRFWRRLYTQTPFERQHDEGGRRPPLQRELKSQTVTAESVSRGLVRQRGIVVEAIVDGVTEPIDVRLTYVGSGAEEEGIRTGNETLDSEFVLTVEAGSDLREVFDAEVQSTLMEVSTPGEMRIQQESVSYEIPYTRVDPGALGTVAAAVATVAARLEQLVEIGHR